MLVQLSTFNIALLCLAALIVVFIAVFFYFYKRHVYHTKHIIPRTMDWVFLEILMPKENSDDKDKRKSDEEKKNLIALRDRDGAKIQSVGRPPAENGAARALFGRVSVQ